MGVWTTISIVPGNESSWAPPNSFLEALAEFLEISGQVSIEGYPHDNYWDAEHGITPVTEDGVISVVDDDGHKYKLEVPFF